VTWCFSGSRTGTAGVKAIGLSTGPSDQDLVLLMRRRQPGAFTEVYRRHHERIWRFLQRLTGHRALGEDLFQDTWLAAARNAHRLREDSQLLPWLYTIARNKHRNSLRFAAMEQRRRDEAGPPEPPAAEVDVEARAQAARVAEAFPRLTEAHREVLLLCLVEGLDSETAGRVLALRPEAVRKRLSRARAELARLAGFPQGVNHE
jgi:RNA polymerase sigma factor (sigma-70 family)